MQLYWHTKAPAYEPLETVPDNRAYLSAHAVDRFVRRFLRFSRRRVVADVKLLSQPIQTMYGRTAMVEFPGGYIAEIHDVAK